MFPAQSFLLPYIPLSRDQSYWGIACNISNKSSMLTPLNPSRWWCPQHQENRCSENLEQKEIIGQHLSCPRLESDTLAAKPQLSQRNTTRSCSATMLPWRFHALFFSLWLRMISMEIYGFRKCCVFCCILYIFNSCAEIITINLLPWLVKLFFIGLLGKYLAHCRKILVIYFYFHNFHTAEVGSRCKDMLVWQLIMFCFIQVGYIHCGITFGRNFYSRIFLSYFIHVLQVSHIFISLFTELACTSKVVHAYNFSCY